ncbi:MAG: septal ring lytic transglycosylase RlpA family protein [Hydrogenophaga sp.]
MAFRPISRFLKTMAAASGRCVHLAGRCLSGALLLAMLGLGGVAWASVQEGSDPLTELRPSKSLGTFDSNPAEPTAKAPDDVISKGLASWYGGKFHGRRTANGEIFDKNALTAAHKTLPFGTRVRVKSVQTGKAVVVRINDRGPYKGKRVIDLSSAAASALGMKERGVFTVVLLRE